MLDNILNHIITTVVSFVIVTLMGAVIWLFKRVNNNTNDIEKLIELEKEKEKHSQRTVEEHARRMVAIESKLDALHLLLIQAIAANKASDN